MHLIKHWSLITNFIFLSLLFFSFTVQAADLEVSTDELEAYNAYLQFNDIKAKNLIKSILEKNPNSPVAYYVKGMIIMDSEGNTTKALLYFKKSIELSEKVCGKAPFTSQCVRWHSLAYQEKIESLGNLDKIDGALKELDYYDSIYNPDLDYKRVWFLIKKKRLDEAEVLANKILANSSDPYSKVDGLNSLCVIFAERDLRIKSDEVCSQAASQTESMVIHYNAAMAKFTVFDHQGAEKISKKAVNLIRDLHGTSWEVLVQQYILEARFSEAVASAKESAKVQRTSSGLDQELNRAHHLMTISHLLMVLGRMEDAYRLATESYETPDRTGRWSGHPHLTRSVYLTKYLTVLKFYEEYLEEQRPRLSLKESVLNRLKVAELKFKQFIVKRKIQKYLQTKGYLEKILTPYPPSLGPVENVPIWELHTFIDATGPSLFLKAVEGAQKAETELLDKSKPYYHYLKTLEKYYRGDFNATIKIGEEAMGSLPNQERLVRDLLKTILAHSYESKGEKKKAVALYTELLKSTPSFIRYFGLAIPIKFNIESGPYSKKAYRLLKNSPRFKKKDYGIKLNIKSTNDFLSLCLMDDYGSEIHCTAGKIIESKNTPSVTYKNIAQNFINEAFSPKVDLSQLDVNTLNGAPTRGLGTEIIQKILPPNGTNP